MVPNFTCKYCIWIKHYALKCKFLEKDANKIHYIFTAVSSCRHWDRHSILFQKLQTPLIFVLRIIGKFLLLKAFVIPFSHFQLLYRSSQNQTSNISMYEPGFKSIINGQFRISTWSDIRPTNCLARITVQILRCFSFRKPSVICMVTDFVAWPLVVLSHRAYQTDFQ